MKDHHSMVVVHSTTLCSSHTHCCQEAAAVTRGGMMLSETGVAITAFATANGEMSFTILVALFSQNLVTFLESGRSRPVHILVLVWPAKLQQMYLLGCLYHAGAQCNKSVLAEGKVWIAIVIPWFACTI